ncbi:dihydropteroate synthase [Litorisediminicola beolgyonensis]|uniref:Dihydropteroate synthase n=1 Tax=Litorisediminicola beolgyonensis TaxID=1173614 RepID=A0ABW3ZDV9_9RHOB
MSSRFRPLPLLDRLAPSDAHPLAGGPVLFTHVEDRESGDICRLADLPNDIRAALTAPRAPLAGLSMDRPRVMGILNVTPDSFSDGGQHFSVRAAVARGRAMLAEGADILDIGGESTRPGAAEVPVAEEIARVVPVIEALAAETRAPISIDTRKARVAEAALAAGATLVNDVSAMSFDPEIAAVTAEAGAALCLMHAQGTPETMQEAPRYDDVLGEVADYLAERVSAAIDAGIAKDRVCVDPGIGFGKNLLHNLALLRGIALYHGLGCPILLGASRKRFIGTVSNVTEPGERMPGSLGVALAAAAQGVQILRVHDVAETAQALRLWAAIGQGESYGT